MAPEPSSSTPVALTVPLHFGPEQRPLFGCLHWPTRPWSGIRIVLCAPLGYEGQFSFQTLRELATHLADTIGAAVLRFDYDGCGDSSGSDEDRERVPMWLASVGHAMDEIKRQARSDGPLILIGMRAGALLAAAAAAARDDVTGLALWAPCRSGRLFLREQRAFSAMAFVTATAAGAGQEKWGEHGFEANGYVFTDETVKALEALDFKNLPKPPAEHLLVLDRAEMPTKALVPESWRGSGANLELAAVPGYPELMQPPWLSKRPVEAVGRIVDWLNRWNNAAALPVADQQPTTSVAQVLPGVAESAIWYDEQQRRFGILTEPAAPSKSHVLLLVTSTYGYRVGPNRMNVAVARHVASQGIATLRMDLASVSEARASGPVPHSSLPNTPYDMQAIQDLELAIQYLRRCGYQHIALGGICAGAFLAWYGAVTSGNVSQVLLVNAPTFVPIHFDLQTHLKTEHAPPRWSERLRNAKSIIGKVRVIGSRTLRLVAIAAQLLRARLPATPFGSPLAGKIRKLGKRGMRTSVIFSNGDTSEVEFRRELGPKIESFKRAGYLSVVNIDGPDHSFTPRWANRLLTAALADQLDRWMRHTRAPEAAPPVHHSATATDCPSGNTGGG